MTGKSVDWLDIHNDDGIEAVRAGVKAAEPFVPTAAERKEDAFKIERQSKRQEIAETYPLPRLDTLKLAYMPTRDGAIKVHKMMGVDGNGSEQWVPITTPFGIPARLRYVDQADAYGLRVTVQDMEGNPRQVDFDRAGLAKMAGAEIKSMLFAAGLRIEADGDLVAIQCLKAADPDAEIVIVRQPGWHYLSGLAEPVFVGPDGSVIGGRDSLAIELARSGRMPPDVAQGGNLDEWKRATAAAITADGVPHWTLGVIAGFAGPILSLTGFDTCGINLSGISSAGKSTAQRLAASAWSTPDIRRPGLCQSARATDNAIEALASRATGTVLSLDELGHVSGKAAAKMIYTIAGGVGKKRMTADAAVRDGVAWSTFALLSGECSLAEKIKADGEEWLAGMAVRIADIDVSEINRQIDPEVLQHISQINTHYGHAGSAFVRALIEADYHKHAGALRAEILRAAQSLAGKHADSPQIRAATPFALLQIAGDLACEFRLIPETTDVEGAVAWGWERFRQSSDAMALDPEAQALANIRAWIAERWNVTIKPLDFDSGINNRETVAWHDETTLYLPRARLREAAGGVLKESAIAETLDRCSLLTRREDQYRRHVRYVPKIGKVEAYALKRSEFGRTGLKHDAANFRVHEAGQSADPD
jgi:putative DNA primase/helicase